MNVKKASAAIGRRFRTWSGFISLASGLLCLAASVPNMMAQSAAQLISTRSISLPPPAGGNGESMRPLISPDGRFVLFDSSACNLAPGAGGPLIFQVYLRDRASNTTTLVSVNLNGIGGNGNSTWGGMSSDGRYVVFQSDASDLVAGDTNGVTDIFVRDLVAGTTVLASVSTSGIEGDGPSTSPMITPDGRYVAFVSTANSLVLNDYSLPNVYVRDLVMQTTVLASPGTPFTSPTRNCLTSPPAITPDGRYVAFATPLTGLVPGATNNAGDVYVRDLVANQTTWASTNASALADAILGGTNYQSSEHPEISDDGTFVTFKTGSGGNAVVFQYNMTNGTTTTIHTNALLYTAGTAAFLPADDDFYGPEVTPDGRFVAFVAIEAASQGSTNYGSVRLWDSETGTNVVVCTNASGVYSPGTLSQAPAVTPDGHYVAFLSNAGDLTTNAVSKGFHIFLRDMVGGSITLVDVDTNGAGSTDFEGMSPSLSTNGQFVAFSGPDGQLAPLDINGADDVFLRDTSAGVTQMISQRSPSAPVRSGAGQSMEGPSSISADGRWVAFASYATDLVPNDTNNLQDVFVCDRWSGSNTLVSMALNGGCALGGGSMSPMISTNGRYVIIVSAATNLTTNVIANPGNYNIYRRDLQLQTTVLVTVNTNGATSGNQSSSSPAMSQDGRYVAFISQAGNLAAGVTMGGEFWRDIDGGVTVAFLTNTTAYGSNQYAAALPFSPTISEDGRYVAYAGPISGIAWRMCVWDSTLSHNIFTNTASFAVISPDGSRLLYLNGGTNYVRDLLHGTNMLAINGAQRIRSLGVWSGNGRFVAIVTSTAVSGMDTNKANDVYLCDLQTPTNILVSVNASLTGSGNAASDWPAVSWDGRFVIFRSFSTNLVAGHTNAPDMYLYDTTTGTNSLLTTEEPTADLAPRPSQPVISLDGSSAVFQSSSSGLAFGDGNRWPDVFAAVLPPAAGADTDGDGIPDWWMIQYFGHICGEACDQSLAQDDPNGTGMTTLQDYIAGTNPTDPNSVFLAAVAPLVSPGGSVTLTWSAVAGRTYSIQYKDSLEDSVWNTLEGAPTISGNQGQFSVPTDQTSRYYRIVVQ
jgi:Tol biopolymer transport system component